MPEGGKQYFFGKPPAGGKGKAGPMASSLANFKKKGAFKKGRKKR